MRIAVAADHRGYEAKRKLLPVLKQWGHDIQDFGCHTASACTDYPDYAIPVSLAVAEGQFEAGILLDGSGIGMSVAANKVVGVRAALAHDEVTARISREANHCNVLCLGSDLLNDAEIRKIIQVFLATPFGDGRHARRVQKLNELERSQARAALSTVHRL
ncbi:MAG: RpiB/LacA/LacB family sugar-phosphate isomerase [Bacillota bacterium]